MNNGTFIYDARGRLLTLRQAHEACQIYLAAEGSLYHKWFTGRLTVADFDNSAEEMSRFTNAIAAFQAIDATYVQQIGAIIPVAR